MVRLFAFPAKKEAPVLAPQCYCAGGRHASFCSGGYHLLIRLRIALLCGKEQDADTCESGEG